MRKRPKNGTCGNFPETCGNFPETCGNFPKRAGICPKRAGICPKRAGICPKRAGIFGTGRKIGFFGFFRFSGWKCQIGRKIWKFWEIKGNFWCERFLGEMTKTVAVFMTEIRWSGLNFCVFQYSLVGGASGYLTSQWVSDRQWRPQCYSIKNLAVTCKSALRQPLPKDLKINFGYSMFGEIGVRWLSEHWHWKFSTHLTEKCFGCIWHFSYMSCKSTLRLRVLVAGPQRHSSFSDVFCCSVSNKCFSLSFVFCRLPKQALFSNRCVVTRTIRSDLDQDQMIGFSILNLLYQAERVHSTGPFFVRTKHCNGAQFGVRCFTTNLSWARFCFLRVFPNVPRNCQIQN